MRKPPGSGHYPTRGHLCRLRKNRPTVAATSRNPLTFHWQMVSRTAFGDSITLTP